MSYQVIYIDPNEESLLQKRVAFLDLKSAINFAQKHTDCLIKHECQEKDFTWFPQQKWAMGICKVCNKILAK